MSLSELFKTIEKSVRYDSLDYKWAIRKFIMQNPSRVPISLKNYFIYVSQSPYKYYLDNIDKFNSDKSLACISQMCCDKKFMINVDEKDQTLFKLSRQFNKIIGTTRKLHMCYDCGTVARAVFLKLIETHRGTLKMDSVELNRMKQMYCDSNNDPVGTMRKCWDFLTSVDSDTVVICGIGIDNFGHVWVLEKIYLENGQPRYRIYQSCLNSYMLIDFIEEADYAKHPNIGIDIDDFFNSLEHILSRRTAWEEKDYHIFTSIFAFMPVSEVMDHTPTFCYGYIICGGGRPTRAAATRTLIR